jgi:putative hydrolase of the HAD superfamily
MLTVLLDVDGVLVNGRPRDGNHLFTDLARDLGISLPVLQREFFIPRWPDIVRGRKPLLPELAEVLARIAPQVSAETLLDYWLANDSRIDHALLASVDVLRRDGTRVFLATNQEHHRARYLMEEMALAAHVDGIFYSAALGHRKPDRGFYAAVAAALPADGSARILVDDTEANITAARRFGWRAVHWQAGMKLEDEVWRALDAPAPG